MSSNPQHRETGDVARSFFARAVALFAAMLLALAVIDGYRGSIAAGVILLGYVLGSVYRKRRRKTEASEPPGGFRVTIAILIIVASGFMAVTGVIGTVIIAWLNVAYTPFEIGGWQMTPPDGDIVGGLRHVLTMLAGGAVFLALGVLLLHWGRGGLGILAARLHRHGIGLILSPWLKEAALLTLLSGAAALLSVSVSLDYLVDAMSVGRSGGFLAVIELFPFLVLGLAALAVLAVAWVDLTWDFALLDDLVRVLRAEDDGPPPRRDGWLRALTAITLAGAAGIVGSMLWALHIAFLAAGVSTPALLAATLVGGKLDAWAVEMQAAGQTAADLVVMANDRGFWRPEAPDSGLVTLMPGLGDSLSEAGLQPGCRVAVAASAADAGDAARPTPDISGWQPPASAFESQREPAEETAVLDDDDLSFEPYETSPLRYCVKVSCPVPVTWGAPPAISLYSSHPSHRPEWMLWIYFDLFAEGRAAQPGGYCTTDGGLAGEYQG